MPPYSRRPGRATQSSSSPQSTSSSSGTWTSKFFCLGKIDDKTTADRAYCTLLEQNGLGHKKITFANKYGSHEEFVQKLEEEFPPLKSQGGALMLWRCLVGGNTRRPLTQILPGPYGYSIPFIREKVPATGTVYITPLQTSICDATSSTSSADATLSAFAFCTICKKQVLLNIFANHLENCSRNMLKEDLKESNSAVTDNEDHNSENAFDFSDDYSNTQAVTEKNMGNVKIDLDLLCTMFPNKDRSEIAKVTENCTCLDDAVDLLLPSISKVSPNFLESNRDVKTLKGLHKHLKNKLAGDYCLKVDRDEIWRCVLTHYKKAIASSCLGNLKKDLTVQFSDLTGESEAIDAGAIKMEFYNKAYEIAQARLLEGDEVVGLIPKRLGSSGNQINYQVLGLLIGDAFIQSGLVFSPFPEWIYQFLAFQDPEDIDMLKWSISAKDVPKCAATAVFHELVTKLSSVANSKELDELLDIPEYLEKVNSSQWDPTEMITLQNKDSLVEELVYDELIRKRRDQLQSLRQGISLSGLLQWVHGHQEMMKDVFVMHESEIDLKDLFNDAIKKVKNQDGLQSRTLQWFCEFVDKADKETMKSLFRFTTSLRNVPPWGLENSISVAFLIDDEKFVLPKTHVCFNILLLPVIHTKQEKFFDYMNIALTCENSGFSAEE